MQAVTVNGPQLAAHSHRRTTERALAGALMAGVMLAGFLPLQPAAAKAAAAATIITEGGEVSGVREGGANVWRNIPFASAARWEAPQPAQPWQGVRDGSKPGPICPQVAEAEALKALPQSEDCLNLNVWAPAGHTKGRLPVMLWIHGGSFRIGSGSQPTYDGEALTARGVVLVTINYRLGILGRFAHPDLSREQAGKPRANYGLMDQVAALQWVKRNIANFGGDPDNVTIFGYSAGGVSVNYLMAAPSAFPFFNKAIAQSGGIQIETTRHISDRRPGPMGAPLEAEGLALAKQFGSGDTPAPLAALRKLPVADLLAFQEKHALGSLNPVVDGVLIPDDIGRTFKEGQQARVPYMAGSTSWEASLIENLPRPLPPKVLLMGIADVDGARKAFGGLDDAALGKAWFADSVFLGTAHYLTRASASIGQPAWLYLFDYVPTALRGTVPGVAHGDEVPFIFGTLPGKIRNFSASQISREDRKVSQLMTAYWANFARSGNPNGKGLPMMVDRASQEDAINILDATPHIERGFKASEMQYLDSYYQQHMSSSK